MTNAEASEKSSIPVKKYSLLVFLTALSCLMLELFLSKMASFHLGQSYAYLAIPITFLGLAIGGIHVHMSRGRIVERFSASWHVLTLWTITLFSLTILLVMFRYYFPVLYETVMTGADNHGFSVMTDDIPFLRGLGISEYTLTPPEGSSFLGWAKITTLLIIVVLSLVILTVVNARSDIRPPPSVLIYLLVTGFCYMLSEIALMAKLELFLKDPLLSMATVLSVFLIAGGVGSRLVRRLELKLDMRIVPFGVAAMQLATIFLFDAMNTSLATLPVALKLILAAVAVFTIGVTLGLFYPYLISCLVAHKMDHVVPLTMGSAHSPRSSVSSTP